MLTRLKKTDTQPIGLAEVKAHLRLDHSEEDEYLNRLIQAATEHVEQSLGRSLLKQTWEVIWQKNKSSQVTLTSFGTSCIEIPLPYPPILQIAEVNELMPGDQKKIIRRYMLDTQRDIPHLVLADTVEAVQIVYTAGYGEWPTTVPWPIRQAILHLVTDWYENRINGGTQINSMVDVLLKPYRVMRLV
jgi:uncharacterized phiE125 gp8 family phage protein